MERLKSKAQKSSNDSKDVVSAITVVILFKRKTKE
jgi:hypothetical protein